MEVRSSVHVRFNLIMTLCSLGLCSAVWATDTNGEDDHRSISTGNMYGTDLL